MVTRCLSRAPVKWELRCDCGGVRVWDSKEVYRAERFGSQSTCGCVKHTVPPTTHGWCGTPEWKSWQAMIARCEKEKSHGYKNYGGRGIKICQRRRHSFESFLGDLGPKPSPQHTLGRIDVDGDYSPENCRWETRSRQAMGKRPLKRNTSGFTGVVFHKWSGRWMVTFRGTFLGYFSDPKEASSVYEKSKSEYIDTLDLDI